MIEAVPWVGLRVAFYRPNNPRDSESFQTQIDRATTRGFRPDLPADLVVALNRIRQIAGPQTHVDVVAPGNTAKKGTQPEKFGQDGYRDAMNRFAYLAIEDRRLGRALESNNACILDDPAVRDAILHGEGNPETDKRAVQAGRAYAAAITPVPNPPPRRRPWLNVESLWKRRPPGSGGSNPGRSR